MKGDKAMTIRLTSPAFAEGQPIAKKYTGEGSDVSPALEWSGLPQGTQELALICDDPDAPMGTWVHWVIYKIPADATGLPEGVARQQRPKAPAGALQGKNSWPNDNIGYRGPLPPPGKPHRYYFKLYALDAKLAVEPGLDKAGLLRAIEGHMLAQGQWMGTYRR
jgi:Raf kinase inhibitor-like YbhB/YbcL family protein